MNEQPDPAKLNREYLENNVVPLRQPTDQEAEKSIVSQIELEERRKLIIKSLDIAANQLENDGQKAMENARLGEYGTEQFVQMVLTGNSLLCAAGWLRSLTKPTPVEAPSPAGNN